MVSWVSGDSERILNSPDRPSVITRVLPFGEEAGEGNGTPLQYSCLENPMDGGAWWAAVHGVSRSQTRLSDVTFTFHFPALEKEMATHSSVLAWRIPGTAEPGGLPSMGLHRVGHDWSDLATAAAAGGSEYWERKKCKQRLEWCTLKMEGGTTNQGM